jgi:hypothetical protein
MKSKGMIEIDDMVEEWQKTKSEEVATKLYDRLKWYFHKYGHDDQQISDAHIAFTRALITWEKNSNVWFIVWFNRLWMQHRRETSEYLQKKKRSGQQLIPLDALAYKNNDELQVADVIPDEEELENKRKRENARLLTEFMDKHDVSERERIIIENVYYDMGYYQTDLAKKYNVSQAMIHKSYKRIKERPYAQELYQLLKEMMQNG